MDVNRRRLIAPLLFFALAVLCTSRSELVARPAAGAPQALATGPKTAEQVYKNIQVLKGVPADQLLPSMRYFTVALGVQCNFCHVNPWDKDAKPEKQMARKMIAIVFAVDKDTFGGERTVTCYTCHRGSATPVPGALSQILASRAASWC